MGLGVKNMKKVLYVATVVKTHIMEFHISYLKMLKEMGFETAVAARNDYENSEDCKIPYCDNYYDIPFERKPLSLRNISAYRQLKKIIDKGNYDIIHCHTPVGAMLTRIASRRARKHGTKVIYTAHGFHFFAGAPLKNWLLYYPVEWICSWWTDVLITINKEDYARASDHLHAKKTVYVPGVGIDTAKFAPPPNGRDKIRKELGLADDQIMLLSVGELNTNKNHKAVIKALQRMQETVQTLMQLSTQSSSSLRDVTSLTCITYVIVGSGELEEELRTIAKKTGVDIRLTGYRTDVADFYDAADVYILPSLREGLIVCLMEAMASDCAMTIPMIAEVSGSSVRTVKRYLKEFQGGDILKREGSDTSGEWILS